VEGFDEDIVEELRARARDALLTDALAVEEGVDDTHPEQDLLDLDGMDEATAFELARHGITNREGLSDLAVDELMELGIAGLDEPRARKLILVARGL